MTNNACFQGSLSTSTSPRLGAPETRLDILGSVEGRQGGGGASRDSSYRIRVAVTNQATPEKSLPSWTLPGRQGSAECPWIGHRRGCGWFGPVQTLATQHAGMSSRTNKSTTQITDLCHSCPI